MKKASFWLFTNQPIKYLSIFALLICIALGVATSSVATVTAPQLVKCGIEWINIHKENPKLIGIYVQQKPDSRVDANDYEGTHPAMIIYVFNDGWKHTVTYTPSGQVQNGVWSTIEKNDWVYKAMGTEMRPNLECAYWVTE